MRHYQTTIDETQLDAFGHVNNAVYLELYEAGRWHFLEQRNYAFERMQATGCGVILLKATVKFQRELLLGDHISIDMHVDNISGKLFTVSQRIRKKEGEIASTATFLLGFWEMKKRRLVRPTKEWLAALS